MPVEHHDFFGSTNVESADYDTEKEQLTVTFLSGRRYQASEFPPSEWRAFQQAPSAGRFARAIENLEEI